MKKLLDCQVTNLAKTQVTEEIERILNNDSTLDIGDMLADGYTLYVDASTHKAVFSDNNQLILVWTDDMPSYDIRWDDNDGWVIAD